MECTHNIAKAEAVVRQANLCRLAVLSLSGNNESWFSRLNIFKVIITADAARKKTLQGNESLV